MALIRFSKVPKNRQYEYKPRFWNPEKEEREEFLRQLELRKEGTTEGLRERVRSGFRRGAARDYRFRQQQVRRSNVRLFAIVMMLLIATYLFLVKYLPAFEQALEKKFGN